MHSFMLILAGVPDLTPELSNTMFEAVDAEIEFEMRDGLATLKIQRRAKSLRDAIVETIREVRTADLGVRVVRVESEAANTIARINAELLSVTS